MKEKRGERKLVTFHKFSFCMYKHVISFSYLYYCVIRHISLIGSFVVFQPTQEFYFHIVLKVHLLKEHAKDLY